MALKNERYFEINRMFVLAMRSIGKGHSEAKRKNTKVDEFIASCTLYLLEKTYRNFD